MSFSPRPSYQTWNASQVMSRALDRPYSRLQALGENIGQGIMDSFGLGTAIRDFTTPRGETRVFPKPEAIHGGDFGPYGLVANAYEGARQLFGAPDDSRLLSEDEYKSSPYFREAVPWDEGMSEDRAAALAAFSDLRATRAHFSEKQPIAAFAGQLLGQAFDPINYVPVFGPGARIAAVARFGGIKGRALLGASEAAINTAFFGVVTRDIREKLGDDVSFNAMAMEIAMAALIGGAFGAGIAIPATRNERVATRENARFQRAELSWSERNTYATARRHMDTMANVQRSTIPLNEAIDTLATDGEVRLSPNGIDVVERVRAEVADRTARIEAAAQPRTTTGVPIPGKTVQIGTVVHQVHTSDIPAGAMPANTEPIINGLAAIYAGDKWVSGRVMDGGRLLLGDDGLMYATRWDAMVELPNGEAPPTKPPPWVSAAPTASVVAAPEPPKIAAEVARHLDPHARGRRPNLSPEAQRAIDTMPPRIRDLAGKPDDPDYPEFTQWLDATARMNGEPEPSRAGVKRPDVTAAPAEPPALDLSAPRPDPMPEGLDEAAARVGRPETLKETAEQFGVDPKTGDSPEMADIEAMREQGRLTAEDEAALAAAEQEFSAAQAYEDTLRAAAICVM